MPQHKPLLLLILDGWGYREGEKYNAIAAANAPHWQTLWQHHPHRLIEGSGHYVGLPDDQMGNSEVGHLNMGAGRIVYQDYTRVSASISDQSFFENPVLLSALQHVKQHHAKLHILGLLSPGGVHSHEDHLHALLDFAKQEAIDDVYLHAILDGRDTPPKSAKASLQAMEDHFRELGIGRIASIIGRYYAMDRDQRWDRTRAAYDLLTQGTAYRHATSAVEGLAAAYHDQESDEFVKPTLICAKGETPIVVGDQDVIVFMNFRADRARQLSRAFLQEPFTDFERHVHPQLGAFVSLTQYADNLRTSIAYPPQNLDNTFGEILAKHHLTQLRIAETEKYAHVTFFFNGGREAPFPGEERSLIPSPKVATYDLQPEMSVDLVTDQLIDVIQNKAVDVIICNFANADMVGHSGDFTATVAAIEAIDRCLGRIMQALKSAGGEMLVTADHGNAECMFDETTQQAHTAHTSDPVPLCYVGRPATFYDMEGKLSDIAPTLLYLLGLEIPEEMTGKPLLKLL
jgi:2,3-bisphosphoglycerate-independent phosphoglycerate mutase